MSDFARQVQDVQKWFDSPRFEGLVRLYSARQIVQQRGSITQEYPVARDAAAAFYDRLRELFSEGKSITTFGPYSPGQAVAIKRKGIEGIYLGGWATSAKGSASEDPGPDLASYPLSQVPNEAAVLVRALLTADRNQHYLRSRMTEEERENAPVHDFRPFIIADADTGHGGDPHVRNLIRRFVEAGVPGYHIEDQRPGTKKCGHQGGKVLVASDEQIKRLNAARFQLDVMGVPGIIVARTDAEAATLLDGSSDERDQPFLLGATHRNIPAYRTTYLALIRRFFSQGISELNGHLLYSISDEEYAEAEEWLDQTGLTKMLDERVAACREGTAQPAKAFDEVATRLVEMWESAAGLHTYGEAVAQVLEFLAEENEELEMSADAWRKFSRRASFHDARNKARSLGVTAYWDSVLARTPEGFYQVRGGIEYAIVKSLAAAPFADILWMETKTADLEDAKRFAEAIHAEFPNKMLAYNLSPSFNWDSTGMSDDDMRAFATELGKMGFVFNFITYGGHQIDGVAAEEFSTELQREGMLALARLQRKIRLLESPYRTPQTLVGGPRLDGALAASSGRTATTKAMGKGSTQVQHLIQTEVPKKLLEEWLSAWGEQNQVASSLKVQLLPQRAGSELLELAVTTDGDGDRLANVVFAPIHDRQGRTILSVRDQNTFDEKLRQRRLMTLMHVYLVHRYKADSVHYVSPTEDNHHQTASMKKLGIFSSVTTEVGEIIVADIAKERIAELVSDKGSLVKLIRKEG